MWEEAIKDHSEAIRLQPHYGIAYKHRGKALRAQGKHHASLQDFSAALQVSSVPIYIISPFFKCPLTKCFTC